MKICEGCGIKPVLRKHEGAKFCSRECSLRFQKRPGPKHISDGRTWVRTCVYEGCTSTFETSAVRQVYCSVECRTAKWTDKRRANRSGEISVSLLSKTDAWYARKNLLRTLQDNKCALCSNKLTTDTEAFDHDHETGEHRELLCRRCNVGLGYFMDDPVLLQRAIDYINKHRETATCAS